MRGKVRKKKKGKKTYWYAVIVDKQGKEKWIKPASYLGLNRKAKQEDAKKVLRKVLDEIDEGKYIEPDNTTFKEFSKYFLKNHDISENTRQTYERQLKNHVWPAIGELQISEVKPFHVQELINSLDYSYNTIKYIHNVIKAVFSKAIEWEVCRKNPAKAVKIPKSRERKRKGEKIQYWNEHEVVEFLDFLEGDRLYCFFFLAIYTGMRRSELMGLRWSDVDLKNGKINVEYAYVKFNDGTCELQDLTKSEYSKRTISVSKKVVDELKRHKKRQARELLAYQGKNEDNLVFTNVHGKPHYPDYINRKFKNTIRKLNVSDIQFKNLRHTHASLLIKAINSEKVFKVISERLGHHSIAFTMDTYGHLLQEVEKQSANDFEELLNK